MKKHDTVIDVLTVVMVLLMVYLVFERLDRDLRPPISQWRNAVALSTVSMDRPELPVDIHRTKVRDDCSVASDRQVFSEDGRAYKMLGKVWEGGSANESAIRLNYTIPSAVLEEPGEYTLRVYLTYTCPEFVWTTQQPDVDFTVEDK